MFLHKAVECVSSCACTPVSSCLSPPCSWPPQACSGLLPSPLGSLALAFLLSLLELPETPCPRVLPLDQQASLVSHDAPATLKRAVPPVITAQEEVLGPVLDFGASTGHILGPQPQGLVAAPDAAAALLVDGDHIDDELPPFADFVSLQDVHLKSCELAERERWAGQLEKIISQKHWHLSFSEGLTCVTAVSLKPNRRLNQWSLRWLRLRMEHNCWMEHNSPPWHNTNK